MIEKLFRVVFKAPRSTVQLTEDTTLPGWSIGLTERTCAEIGVEPGEIAMIHHQQVTVFSADENCASPSVVAFFGESEQPVRRRVLSRVARHLLGGAWTLAGMVIVVVTLTGSAQVIALFLCVVAFVADLMSIAIRRP